MASLLPEIYQALVGVGVLAALALALGAFFFPLIEPRLLHWLERRRARREAGPGPRLGIRRGR